MIVFSVCNSCFESYQLTIMPGDVELVRQIMDKTGRIAPCPRLCGGAINVVGDPTIQEMSERINKPRVCITGKELYQAVNGAGLPDEIPKELLVITTMLKNNKIIASDIEHANGKFYIHELTLENGVTLHFSGGPRGAQLLKMTKPKEKKESHGTASAG